MDALILVAWVILVLYLLTRKWFWLTMLTLGAIAILFTPLASIMAVVILVAAAAVVLHLLFMAAMLVLSTLFLFS